MEIRSEILRTLDRDIKPKTNFRSLSKPKSNITKAEFCENVEKAKEYIKNGDIFQVVISQRFCIENYNDPFQRVQGHKGNKPFAVYVLS